DGDSPAEYRDVGSRSQHRCRRVALVSDAPDSGRCRGRWFVHGRKIIGRRHSPKISLPLTSVAVTTKKIGHSSLFRLTKAPADWYRRSTTQRRTSRKRPLIMSWGTVCFVDGDTPPSDRRRYPRADMTRASITGPRAGRCGLSAPAAGSGSSLPVVS